MKVLCIYTPKTDSSLPSAICPTAMKSNWQQVKCFEKFRTQFDLAKTDYHIQMYTEVEKVQPKRFNKKSRWEAVLQLLATENNYYVKGKRNVWSLYKPPVNNNNNNTITPYVVYPLPDTELLDIVNSIVLSERRDYMYCVIARYLHKHNYPTPNMGSRLLYMETLFGKIHEVANQVAKEIYENRKKRDISIIYRYCEIDKFWESAAINNTICAKMKDLGSTRYVRAVLPHTRQGPLDQTEEKSDQNGPCAA